MLPTATHIFQWPMRMREWDVATVLAFTSVILKVTGYMTCIVRRTCLLVWRISVLNKNKHTKHSCLVHLDSSDDFRLLQIKYCLTLGGRGGGYFKKNYDGVMRAEP